MGHVDVLLLWVFLSGDKNIIWVVRRSRQHKIVHRTTLVCQAVFSLFSLSNECSHSQSFYCSYSNVLLPIVGKA